MLYELAAEETMDFLWYVICNENVSKRRGLFEVGVGFVQPDESRVFPLCGFFVTDGEGVNEGQE